MIPMPDLLVATNVSSEWLADLRTIANVFSQIQAETLLNVPVQIEPNDLLDLLSYIDLLRIEVGR